MPLLLSLTGDCWNNNSGSTFSFLLLRHLLLLSCIDLAAVKEEKDLKFPSRVNSPACPLWLEAFNILRGSAVGENKYVGLLCCFVHGDAVVVLERSLPGLKRRSWVVGRNTLNPLSSVW